MRILPSGVVGVLRVHRRPTGCGGGGRLCQLAHAVSPAASCSVEEAAAAAAESVSLASTATTRRRRLLAPLLQLGDVGSEVLCARGRQIALLLQEHAQVVVRAHVHRVCGDGGAVGSLGASLVPALVQDDTQVVVRVRVLRLCGDGGAEGSLGASLIPALAQEDAQVAVRNRVRRVCSDGGAEGSLGASRVPGQHSVVLVQARRLLDGPHRLLPPALLCR